MLKISVLKIKARYKSQICPLLILQLGGDKVEPSSPKGWETRTGSKPPIQTTDKKSEER